MAIPEVIPTTATALGTAEESLVYDIDQIYLVVWLVIGNTHIDTSEAGSTNYDTLPTPKFALNIVMMRALNDLGKKNSSLYVTVCVSLFHWRIPDHFQVAFTMEWWHGWQWQMSDVTDWHWRQTETTRSSQSQTTHTYTYTYTIHIHLKKTRHIKCHNATSCFSFWLGSNSLKQREGDTTTLFHHYVKIVK